MSQQELLKKVIQTLEYAEIDYMVTGSVASSLQGEPRSTHLIERINHELPLRGFDTLRYSTQAFASLRDKMTWRSKRVD